MVVERLLSYWEGHYSGAMLNVWRAIHWSAWTVGQPLVPGGSEVCPDIAQIIWCSTRQVDPNRREVQTSPPTFFFWAVLCPYHFVIFRNGATWDMFVAKQKRVHHHEWSWPQRPQRSQDTDLHFLPHNPSSNPQCFLHHWSRVEHDPDQPGSLPRWKNKLPMILFSTCFKRWAPQETRQNEGSSRAILGKKWSCQFFLALKLWWIWSPLQLNPPQMAWPCQIFVHKNVDGKQALVRLSAFRSSWAV